MQRIRGEKNKQNSTKAEISKYLARKTIDISMLRIGSISFNQSMHLFLTSLRRLQLAANASYMLAGVTGKLTICCIK